MSTSEQLATIRERIEQQGVKVTLQRETIIRILMENQESHISTDEVLERVKNEEIGIGRATVYRTLELLTHLQVIEKLNYDTGVTKYNFHGLKQNHKYHHLVCSRCGQGKTIREDWLHEMEQRIQREHGFLVTDHRLLFMGFFQSCKGQACKTSK